jgi:4'-phosphopantetheinyl transferase
MSERPHPVVEASLGARQGPAAVYTRRFSLDLAAACWPDFESVLTAEERDRAKRLARPEDQRRAAASRALLRVQVGQMLDRDPASLVIVTGPHGKPMLADRALSFNVSHSADRFVIAASRLFEVGVDIEHLALERDVDAAARFALDTDEKAALDALPAERRKLGFLRMWTAKEAALKALGVGFKRPMRELAIDRGGLETLSARAGWRPGSATIDGATVRLVDVSDDGDVAAAAALDSDGLGAADVQPGENSLG